MRVRVAGRCVGSVSMYAPMLDRYRARVSGPLLDRIDLHVEVPRVSVSSLAEDTPATESSAPSACASWRPAPVRQYDWPVLASPSTRTSPGARFAVSAGSTLAAPAPRGGERSLGLSARAYTRILRVARTIADLNGEDEITTAHLAEAIQYRSLDRRPRA